MEEKAAFDIFDKGATGSISREDAIEAIRLCGLNPTQDEISEIFEEAVLDLKNFSRAVKKCRKISRVSREEVAKFFESFGQTDGFVDAQELKDALMTSGDALSQQEIDESFKKFNDQERINIAEFLDEIFK